MIGQISGGKRAAQRGRTQPKRAQRSAPQVRGSPQAAAKSRIALHLRRRRAQRGAAERRSEQADGLLGFSWLVLRIFAPSGKGVASSASPVLAGLLMTARSAKREADRMAGVDSINRSAPAPFLVDPFAARRRSDARCTRDVPDPQPSAFPRDHG